VDPHEGIEELQELLKLPHPPRSIDGVDVSNLSGEDAVGSVVTFVDGRPFKSGYRRFHIRGVAGIDDYAMISEVVARRFRRLKEEQTPFPDVLLIDGGKGHLHAALRALSIVLTKDSLTAKARNREERHEKSSEPASPFAFSRFRGQMPCVLSIAKREEIIYHGEPPIELRLKGRSPALRVLQYVRDEAHRFSVHYHHILRGKKLLAHI
jgi:excinuclease ABC subunit C